MPDTRNTYDGELIVIAAQATNFDGDWMMLADPLRANYGANIQYRVTITGTCTVTLEGRNSPNDTPVVVRTDAVSNAVNVTPYKQLRVRISGITGSVDVRASCPYPLRKAA